MNDETGELAVLHAFLVRFERDQASGGVRSLAEYVAAWPEHAARVEREYSLLTGSAASPQAQESLCIGGYQVVRELGRGGQAVVYLARDPRLQRDVALKVLPRALASVQQELRLQREAHTAARLDDSGICPVYDVGQDGGHAYLAMRYVAGQTLAARLDALRTASAGAAHGAPWPWREVVALFAQLCASLQRAHAAGIVHRDIKPGNIMLGSDGQPVLLDFGLAVDLEAEAPLLTRSGDVFGTPAYLPPERLLGRSRGGDARGDLWAVGVCLYESLTLARPFSAPTLEGIYRAILADEPAEPRRIRRELPADLAAVLTVCLDKAPERRYQSAADLRRDLEAVLAGEPIAARPPGWWRRVRRWHRRHAVLATAIWSVLLGLGAVITVQRSLLVEVRSARDEAAGINRFLVENLLLATTADRARGKEPTASQIFAGASKAVREAFPAPTRVAGTVHHVLGAAYRQLGQRAQASAEFERAREIRTALLGADARETLQTRFELARLLRESDRLDDAERELLAVGARQEALFGPDDADSVTTRKDRVVLQRARGQWAAAEALARSVLASRQRTLAADDRLVLDAEQLLATCLMDQGRRAEAEPVVRRVLAARRRIHGDDSPLVEQSLCELATLLHDMASFDGNQAKWAEAEQAYAEDLALARRIYRNAEPSLAIATNNIGTYWQDRAQKSKDQAAAREFARRAESAFRESLALREQSDGAESVRVATVCSNLAMLLATYGQPGEALPMAERAVAIRERVSGAEHPDTIKALNTLGGCTHRAKDADAALPILREAKDRARRSVNMDPKLVCITELSFVAMLSNARRWEDALAATESVWPRVVACWGERSERALSAARSAAQVARELGRTADVELWEARANVDR